jgi:cytochrome b561
MDLLNSQHRYGLVSLTLHWLMLILLIVVYGCIELRELYPKGSELRDSLKGLHFMVGLTVFILVIFRFVARFAQQVPKTQPVLNKFQHIVAKVTHLSLYLLMIGMPIGGWLILSAEGKPIPFYGLSLPALITENKQNAEFIENIHETVGLIGYYLIAIHSLAAIFHHYIIKDNTLARMLPEKSNNP